jgi:citrate lyase subunit beta-like protein
VIHPAQLSIVQEAFSPSADRIKWASDLIGEFRQHESGGKVSLL